VSLVLDAGALIAFDRGSAPVGTLLRAAQRRDVSVRTSGAVVAQVWRDGPRQARLARLLRGVEVVGLDAQAGRRVGGLLDSSGTTDVVDGHLASIVEASDVVLTSDPEEIEALLAVSGTSARVHPI